MEWIFIYQLMKKRKNMKSKIWYSLVLYVCTLQVFAQQDAQFTQSLLNPNTVNPAFAAARNSFNISLLHRTQWINIEGRPLTQTLSVSSPLPNDKLSVGVNVLNDKIGPAQELYTNLDVAYTLFLRDYRQFSFGVKAGAHMLHVDFSKLNSQHPDDSELLQNIDNKIVPQFGFGLLYQTEKLFLGMSIPDLLETKHLKQNQTDYIAKERMSLYFSGGYAFDIREGLQFQPSFQSKMLTGSPLQVDVAASFMWNEKFSAGVAYRLSSAVSGIVSYKVLPQLQVGVAYDYELTDMSQLTPGSYEFVLKFDNGNKTRKRLINPRFF